jgi:hypothetical protein
MSRQTRRIAYRGLLFAVSSSFSLLALVLALALIDTFPARRRASPSVRFARQGAHFVSTHSHMIRQPFLAEKPADVYRVFVLGGSQAMGAPYVSHDLAIITYAAGLLQVPAEGGVSTWLPYFLSPLVAGKRVEVINACIYAHDLRASVENLEWIVAKGMPDLVVIMGGDNEREPDKNHFANYLHQAPRSAYEALLPRLEREYAAGLDRIVALADAHRVLTYVLTVAGNLRDWIPVDDADFDAASVARLLRMRRYAAVLELLKGGDRSNALRLFYTAKAYDGLGEFSKARAFYVLAKDHDKAFIRCRSPWNEAIRARARGRYVRMLDVEKLVAAQARDGLPGFDVFWDYCHYRLAFNKLLAREVARFYARDRRLSSALAAEIERVQAPDLSGRNVKLLYFLKQLQWLRLGCYRAFAGSSALNSEHAARQYEKARKDYALIAGEISFQREVGQNSPFGK